MNVLWYKNPAEDKNAALPVGNGRLGALVYGRTGHEVIDLFEESVWSGIKAKRDNTEAKNHLKEIRAMLNKNNVSEAQELLLESFTALPSEQTKYLGAGSLHLDFYTSETYGLNSSSGIRSNSFENGTSYKRELDLSSAIVTTFFSKDMNVKNTADFSENAFGSSITYTREVFVSSASDVIVVHIAASTPNSIYFRAYLENENISFMRAIGQDTICATSVTGIPYCTMLTATTSGGSVKSRGGALIVEGADDVTLYIDIETAFAKRKYLKKGGNVSDSQKSLIRFVEDLALQKVCFALGASYQNLKKSHIADYSALYENTPKLSLSESENEFCTEDILYSGEHEKELSEIYYNYSKYLYISSSAVRGKLPPLEKGLWTVNERYNLKGGMNVYLPGVSLDIPLCDKNVFAFLKRLYKNGKTTSNAMFGIDGFAAFASSDIWGDSSPNGTDFLQSYWVLGACRVALLVREYFEYTLDKKFLKKNFYILENAVSFAENFLSLKDDASCVCVSPSCVSSVKEEGEYITNYNREDNVLLYRLFNAYLESAKDLSKVPSSAELVKCRSMLEKLGDIENYNEEKKLNLKELPLNMQKENFKNLCYMKDAVVQSYIRDGVVCVEFLANATKLWKNGSIKAAALKGNIYADVSWKDGSIEEARVYAKPGTKFMENLDVVYLGRHYTARITEGSLDILNILPSTV